ncbi:MAG: penicillin acylase family protein [Wenzhouxiangellaceae bacterium]|nr:penicillin acylase family protein [Wenzhouxiangellaceae bacterium]
MKPISSFAAGSLTALVLSILTILPVPGAAQNITVPGLSSDVTVYTDADGIPTIAGETERDVTFVMAYLHARDRFFQMDFLRRVASGTLGELLGEGAIGNDVQLRTLGLRRAAFASWVRLTPEEKGWVKAYADGVNAWLRNNSLPPEYGALELTAAERWTPVDTLAIVKLLAFQLSFDTAAADLTVDLLTYQGTGDVVGFDGTALFFEDIFRVAPEDDRVSIPTWFEDRGIIQVPGQAESGTVQSAQSGRAAVGKTAAASTSFDLSSIDPAVADSLRKHVQALREIPLLGDSIADDQDPAGSNWFIISGEHTESGYPILANDPHLGLDMPAIFTKENLVIREEGVAVSGVSFAGTPMHILGCNLHICWGETTNPSDVTDYYQEEFLVNNFGLPTHTLYDGKAERLQLVFQSYFVNAIGDGESDNVVRADVGFDAGGITFVVPRRNNGPIVAQPSATTGISIQYTGWGPTFELSTLRDLARATNLAEFKAALKNFTVGGQNFGYADVDGNIAYFSTGTVPLREDLQNNTVDGAPPFLLRDGTGARNNEWLPREGEPVTRGIDFAALPLDEMPQTVNPEQGYIANGNNDPVGVTLDNNALNQLRPGGQGIYYLAPRYVSLRMGRIDRAIQDMIASGDPISVNDMKVLQANNQLLDAEIVVPFVLEAFENATAEDAWPGIAQFAADPRIQEAMGRLAAWDFSTPTGIQEGFDPGDNPLALAAPDEAEIANSVAATIYSVFRGQAIRNTIDATLSAIGLADNLPSGREANRAFMHLLTSFEQNQGVGASGVPFFNVPEIESLPAPTSAADRRDFVLLASLQGALDLLASDEFAPAFANSTDQDDYRWGRLHRIVFEHPLGQKPFNVPRGFGLNDLSEELPGIARSGGFDVVDASSHNARADSVNEFMFSSATGPSRRTVALMTPDRPVVDEIIPGGRSGIVTSPFYTNQLFLWLVNAYLPLDIGEDDASSSSVQVQTFSSP